MEKSKFYGADVEDYYPAASSSSSSRATTILEKKLSPVAAVKKSLPLRGDSKWLDTFHPDEENDVQELPSFEGNYVPPSWSNCFAGRADFEREAMRKLTTREVQIEPIVEKDTRFLVQDDALQGGSHRFAGVPVRIIKQEPSMVQVKKEPIDHELATLLDNLPVVEVKTERIELDAVDYDLYNPADLVLLEEFESWDDLQKVVEDPKPVKRKMEEEQPIQPVKRKIEEEQPIQPAKKPLKVVDPNSKRLDNIEKRFKKKPAKVVNPTKQTVSKFAASIQKAKEQQAKRACQPRAQAPRKKPSYTGDSYDMKPSAAEKKKKQETTPTFHYR